MLESGHQEENEPATMSTGPVETALWRDRWVVLGLLLLGTVLRIYAFGAIPPGLYHDEAQHGLDALQVLNGDLALFFEANNGREPLFIYAVTAAVAILGRTPWAIRIPAVFAGVLTLAATYDLGRVLHSRRLGRWALAVLTVTLWHVHLSRVGYRAVLLPLVTALFLGQAARGLRTRRLGHWAATGFLYALSWYTYSAVRVTPLALAGMILYGLILHPAALAKHKRGAQVFCLVGLCVLLPLGLYTALNPDVVLTRAGQVSVFSEAIHQGRPWRTLGSHLLRTAGMFFVQGDRIWRHNLAYRPVWDPALGLAFLIGLIVDITRFKRQPGAALALLWTGMMAIPTILAEDAPHFLRASGMLPVVALIPAQGLNWIANRLKQLNEKAVVRHLSRIVPILLLVFGATSTIHAYFVQYARADLAYHWFEAGPVRIAEQINRFAGQGWDGERTQHNRSAARTVLIDQELWSSWTAIPYLVPRSRVRFVDETPEAPLDPGVAFIVWPYRNWQADIAPRLPHPAYLSSPEGPFAQGDTDPEPYQIATIILADPLPPLPATVATFEGGLTLHAALVRPVNHEARVQLWWRATEKIPGRTTVFVHYLRDQEKLAQHDSEPAQGHLPTPIWQSGDVILDVHPLPDVSPQPTSDRLRIGLYDPTTGSGLKRLDRAGDVVGDAFETPVILVDEP